MIWALASHLALPIIQNLGGNPQTKAVHLPWQAWLVVLLFQLVMLVVTFGFAKLVNGWGWRNWNLNRPTLKASGIGMIAGFILPGGYFFAKLIMGQVVALPSLTISQILWAVAWIIVMQPLVACKEELMFRGYVCGLLRHKIRPIYIIIVSAVIFSLWHFASEPASAEGFLERFVAGCLLAFVYFRTKSLWVPILCHLSSNLWAGLFSGNFQMGGFFALNGQSGMLDLTIGLSLILASFLFVHFATRETLI